MLEERDLAIEANENNKKAEKKENRFLKKLQKDATESIEHLPDEKVLERLPDPTGWRILVLPYKGQGKTKGGVILTDRKSTRLNSSHLVISSAVFCLKKNEKTHKTRSKRWEIETIRR